MSDTPLKDALDKLGTSGDGLTFEAAHSEKDTKVGVEATKTWGSWSASAAWEYTKQLGNTVLGKVTWRPGNKQ
jgi:hypothetical protein